MSYVTRQYFDETVNSLRSELVSREQLDKRFDDLGGMIKTGFDDLPKLFKPIESRMDSMENRMATMEKKMAEGFERIDLRLDHHVYRFEYDDHENRIVRLEQKTGVGKE